MFGVPCGANLKNGMGWNKVVQTLIEQGENCITLRSKEKKLKPFLLNRMGQSGENDAFPVSYFSNLGLKRVPDELYIRVILHIFPQRQYRK